MVYAILGITLLLSLLQRCDFVQQRLCALLTGHYTRLTGSRLRVARMNFYLPGRVTVDSLSLYDLQDSCLLSADGLTASLNLLPLLRGEIDLDNLSLHGARLSLRRATPQSPLNAQFLVDLLASDDTVAAKAPSRVRLNQLLLSGTALSYHVDSEPLPLPGRFSAAHQSYRDINLNLSLKELSADSLNVNLRRLSFAEQSGLRVESLSGRLLMGSSRCRMPHLSVQLPRSSLTFREMTLLLPAEGAAGGDISFSGRIEQGDVVPADVAPLVPQLCHFAAPLTLSATFHGTLDRFFVEDFSLSSTGHYLAVGGRMTAANLFNDRPLMLNGELTRLSMGRDGGAFLQRNIDSELFALPREVAAMQNILFSGRLYTYDGELQANGTLSGELGRASGRLQIARDGQVEGSFDAQGLAVGRLAGTDDLGLADAAIALRGERRNGGADFVGSANCRIDKIEVREQLCRAIELVCHFAKDSIGGQLRSADEKCAFTADYSYCTAQKEPGFRVEARIDSLALGLLMPGHPAAATRLAARLSAYCRGRGIDDAAIKAQLADVALWRDSERWQLDDFTLNSTDLGDQKMLLLNSPLCQLSVAGHFSYLTLPQSILNVLARNNPLYTPVAASAPRNNFTMNLRFSDSRRLSQALMLPLSVEGGVSLSAMCDDASRSFSMQGHVARMTLGSDRLSEVNLTAGLTRDAGLSGALDARLFMPRDPDIENSQDDEMGIRLNFNSTDQAIVASAEWRSGHSPLYSGRATAAAQASGTTTGINFGIDNLVINDMDWQVEPFAVVTGKEGVSVEGFHAHRDDCFMKIDGRVGSREQDSLQIDLQKIELGYLFDILRFHPVALDGTATGSARLRQLLGKEPRIDSHLSVRDFKFERGRMGDLELDLQWDNERDALMLHGDIAEEQLSATRVRGFLSPANDTINLAIEADNTPCTFLNHLLSGILGDIDGRTGGLLRVVGKMSAINLDGALAVSTPLRVVPTGVLYRLRGDTLRFSPDRIKFDDITVYDELGGSGLLNGEVRHRHLSNFACDFGVQARNMLAYRTTDFNGETFYGSAFIDGRVEIAGGDNRGLRVSGDVRPRAGSFVVYNVGSPQGVADNEFITFGDRTRRRREAQSEAEIEEMVKTNLRIDLQVEATPDLELKVLMNPVTGDYLGIRSNGKVHALFSDRQGFTMQGSLMPQSGVYRFSLQNLFIKELAIQPGSRLLFNGDPFKADLDLKTVYTVNSASLNDLQTGFSQKNRVKVNCLMNIKGTFEKPELAFALELPDGNEEEREMLADATATDEQLNMQFIYLLGIGKFYTYDYNNSGTERSSSEVEALISSSVTGQLNSMLSQIIDNDNWNISGNFTSNERGWNSMEVEGMLSGRLLDNRLLVNGNFGYRDNPLANSNFIGDFEVQWLLTPQGTVSLKGYNKTNDRYFSKTTLTTQGAGILFKKEFDGWRRNLYGKRQRKRQAEARAAKEKEEESVE